MWLYVWKARATQRLVIGTAMNVANVAMGRVTRALSKLLWKALIITFNQLQCAHMVATYRHNSRTQI